MNRPFQPEARIVSEVNCPSCGRRIRGANDDERRARVLTHIRNCNAFKRENTDSGLTVPEGPQE